MRGKERHIFLVLIGLLLFTGLVEPSFAQTPFEVKHPCMGNPECDGDGTTFTDPHPDATAWEWSFGDGGTGEGKTVIHSYQTPGTYVVSLIRTLKDGTRQPAVSQNVQIEPFPEEFREWKSDTTICPGDTLILDPYPNGAPSGAKYIWYPKGDTTQTLKVWESGCYSVEVIMPNGCRIQDKINVKLCMEPTGGEGTKWYFGNEAGLDFQGGSPSPITGGKINTKEGTSVISNSKGELLFYTDGIKVYNADDEEMPCEGGPCEDLKGSRESTQSVLIVPQPTCRGCEYLYNIFTTTSISESEKLLSVTVVDMRKEEGKGAIIEQNRVLHNNTTERLVSAMSEQDTTYWTITHDYGSNTFRIYHATTGGLVEHSTFEGGLAHDTENKGEGQMKLSAADSTGQRQLAVVIPGPERNYVELFGFNDQDGSMSHIRTLDLGESPPTAYGVEFSTDNTKLYVSFMGDGTAPSKLVQYDLSEESDSLIVATAMPIDSSENLTFGSLQAAPDGKIYMAIQGADYLAVIGAPNDTTRILSRLEYERVGVQLGRATSQLGLPNFVQNFTMPSDGPGFSADGFCVNEPTVFTASPLCDPIEDNYYWDFGDEMGFHSGKETEVSYTYTKPGIYTVTLYASNQCVDTLFTKEIEIFDVPELDLGGYVEVCAPEYVAESNVEANYYAWVDLRLRRVVSRDRKHTIYPPGGDFVLLAWNDPDGLCFSADTLNIVLRRPPDLSIGDDLVMCEDSSVTLSAPASPWREYLWSTGETTQEITVSSEGLYWVEAKDANDCVNRDTVQVTEVPRPLVSLPASYALCLDEPGATITLHAQGSSDYEYLWSPGGDTTQQITVTNVGTYTVQVSNELGCSVDFKTEVEDKCEPKLVIPSAFSPDGNGFNDVLDVIGLYLTDFDLKIYNRWGEVIFASTNLDHKWDGRYKGVKVEPGVYAYVATYKSSDFPDRPRYKVRGAITVIR